MRIDFGRLRRWCASALAFGALSCGGRCTDTPATTGARDVVVHFAGALDSDRPLLLYSGMRAGTCQRYEAFVGTPTITLPLVSYDASCYTEVAVFAPKYGAQALAVDPARPESETWIRDAIASGALDLTLTPPLALPVTLWLVANASQQPTARAMRDRLLDAAYPILEKLGAGLSLDTVSRELSPTALVASCNSASSISSGSSVYAASRLNVYFVEFYGTYDALTPAMNCAHKGHQEIIFVSWSNANVRTPDLAHELGHALGLLRPDDVWGHTFDVDGFDASNLMAQGAEVTNISVGQLYAMNFSQGSWLNLAGSALARPVAQACQDSWDGGLCPALRLFQSGWPP